MNAWTLPSVLKAMLLHWTLINLNYDAGRRLCPRCRVTAALLARTHIAIQWEQLVYHLHIIWVPAEDFIVHL